MLDQHIIQTQEKINNLRRLLNMLSKDSFKEYYNESIDPLIERCDIKALKEWLVGCRQKELETMSVQRLRRIARCYHIQRYNYLDKEELLDAIRKAIRDVEDDVSAKAV